MTRAHWATIASRIYHDTPYLKWEEAIQVYNGLAFSVRRNEGHNPGLVDIERNRSEVDALIMEFRGSFAGILDATGVPPAGYEQYADDLDTRAVPREVKQELADIMASAWDEIARRKKVASRTKERLQDFIDEYDDYFYFWDYYHLLREMY